MLEKYSTHKHNRKALEYILIFQCIVFQFKQYIYNWETGADQENYVICHLLGLVNTLPALLDLFISSDAIICSVTAFSALGSSDYIVVSVSFPSNSKWDASFNRIAYDYSSADWDSLGNHLRDTLWYDIFKLTASAAASNFVSGFRLELMYILLILSIRSNLTYLHGFQLLVQVPQLIEIFFFSYVPTE